MFSRMKARTLPFLAAGAMVIQALPDLSHPALNHVEKRHEAIIRRKNEPSKLYKTRKRRQANREGYKANRPAILAWWAEQRGKNGGKAFDLIQGMTNWQNHQWRKNGGKRDLNTVEYFAFLQKGDWANA